MVINQRDYKRYTSSKAWESLKRKVKRRSKGICERCKTNVAAQVHHLTYERYKRELPEDVLHICLQCHADLHPRQNFKLRGNQFFPTRKQFPPTVKVFKNPQMVVVNGRVQYVDKADDAS